MAFGTAGARRVCTGGMASASVARRRIVRSSWWIAACLACGLTSPALAIGPSYDCGKAQTPVAAFICANGDLAKRDLEFVQTYYALRQQSGPGGWQELKREDTDFQGRSARLCGVSAAGSLPADRTALQSCLARQYDDQMVLWKARLRGAAFEEASRPVDQHVALQARLQALGYLPKTETVDGVYGPATRTAIEDWQRAQGLTVTGLLGDADAARLAPGVETATRSLPGAAPAASDPTAPPQTPLVPITDLAAIYARVHQ